MAVLLEAVGRFSEVLRRIVVGEWTVFVFCEIDNIFTLFGCVPDYFCLFVLCVCVLYVLTYTDRGASK